MARHLVPLALVVAAVVALAVLGLGVQQADAAPINVHVVAHSHDDVGWRKTLTEYYYGSSNWIDNGSVQYILDSVVEALVADPRRKFIYVEQAFFSIWWYEQTHAMQEVVRGLVREGRLEFVGGAWCMHDEATTLAVDMIDQTALGHQFITDNFRDIPEAYPNTAWQIDAFGHSGTQAATLTYDWGFDALFFARNDHQDDALRRQNKATEFIWRGSESAGPSNQIFAGTFFSGYGMPDGFCFDLPRCTDEPMLFDPKLDGFNIPARTNEFMQHLHDQAAIMQGATELLVLAGDDFNYASAQQYFKNFEILMDSVNKNGTFRMFYSTPREYVRARNKQQLASSQPSTMTGVKSRSRSQRHVDASTSAVAAPAAGLSWPLKQYSDLFPYSNDDYSYWNGFLVSRPALKMLTRRTSGLLHAVRQLYFLAGRSTSDQQNNPGLQRLREAVAVAQHHDAVTGTSMQHVACDYARRMAEGWTDTAAELQAFLPSLLTKPGGTPPPRGMQTCPLLNISICAASQSNTQGDLAVLLYNGLARNRTELVQVPLPSSPGPSPSAWIVLDSTMQQVPSQVVAQDPSAPGREANISAMNVLVFRATVPAMGATTYFLKLAGKTAPQEPEQSATEKLDAAAALVSISNEYLSLSFDSASGLLVSVSVLQALDGSELHLTAHERNPVHQTTTPLSQDFFMYTPVQNVEVTRGELQNSGAYIFRPNASVPLVAIRDSPSRNVSLSSLQKGPIVQQLTQTFSSWCHQSVRLVAGEPFAHFDWSVGEIPIESGWGGEVVTRYTAPKIASNATWLTDSNGREMQRRVRFQRPDYKLNVTEPVAGEFYPVTTVASISDSVSEMVVLVDRAQGVTSLLDGQLEFMIHRRLLADDDRGVHEALNETAFMSPYPNAVRSGPGLAITGSHQLVLAPAGGAASAIHRPLAARNHMALLQLVQPLAAAGLTAQSYAQKFRTSFASMAPRTSLPVNVELMTLEARVPPTSELTNQVEGPAGGSVLLRLAHQFGVRDHPVLSKPVEVDLALLFAGRPFASITEMSLSGVRPLAEQPAQLVWHVRGESAEERASLAQQRLDARPPLRGSVVTLAPLQIRTFNISFAEPSHLAQPLPAAVETPILRRKAPSAAAGAQPHKHRRSSGKVHIVSEV